MCGSSDSRDRTQPSNVNRNRTGVDATENRAEQRRVERYGSWATTLGAVLVSFLVVPWGLTYYFVVHGPSAGDGPEMLVVGLVALLPGFLMGGTALWVAAHD